MHFLAFLPTLDFSILVNVKKMLLKPHHTELIIVSECTKWSCKLNLRGKV